LDFTNLGNCPGFAWLITRWPHFCLTFLLLLANQNWAWRCTVQFPRKKELISKKLPLKPRFVEEQPISWANDWNCNFIERKGDILKGLWEERLGSSQLSWPTFSLTISKSSSTPPSLVVWKEDHKMMHWEINLAN